jgi:type II secretory pathway pseudopilin PulG
MKSSGLSMIEVLTVTAILAILVIMALTMLPRQLEKSRDSERKSDLQKIKIAFEHYYSDNGCYPSASVLENCGGESPLVHELSPYLQDIPCDPQNGKYYLYLPFDSTGGAGTCDGYRVWSNLENNTDPTISTLKCDGATACGAFNYFEATLGEEALEYNYGVSEGVSVLAGDYEETTTPGFDLDSGYCCGGVCNIWSIGQGACTEGPYETRNDCIVMSSCSE